METIDFVCEDDVSPRVTLLMEYLNRLGVPVNLCSAMPKQPSQPVVLIPKTVDSSWQGAATSKLWSVALYLDERARAIPATHQFAIPSWPARSCDPLLTALANYLKRPATTPFPESEPGVSFTKGKRGSAQKQERRVLIGFGAAAVAFVAWLLVSDPTDSKNAPDATEDTREAFTPAPNANLSKFKDDTKNGPSSLTQPTTVQPTTAETWSRSPTQPAATAETIHSKDETASDAGQTSETPLELAEEFDRQLLAHPHYCAFSPTPQSPLQAATASTTTTRPADRSPPALR